MFKRIRRINEQMNIEDQITSLELSRLDCMRKENFNENLARRPYIKTL